MITSTQSTPSPSSFIKGGVGGIVTAINGIHKEVVISITYKDVADQITIKSGYVSHMSTYVYTGFGLRFSSFDDYAKHEHDGRTYYIRNDGLFKGVTFVLVNENSDDDCSMEFVDPKENMPEWYRSAISRIGSMFDLYLRVSVEDVVIYGHLETNNVSAYLDQWIDGKKVRMGVGSKLLRKEFQHMKVWH